jgi:hypothetical protein
LSRSVEKWLEGIKQQLTGKCCGCQVQGGYAGAVRLKPEGIMGPIDSDMDRPSVMDESYGDTGSFIQEIERVINKYCKENDCNTPDFILAEYLHNCLDAYTQATKSRDKWYRVHLEPSNSFFDDPEQHQ